MPPGHLRLLPQRPQEAPHLRQDVGDPDQVGLGRGDPAEGPLLAPPVLGDARRLLDVGADLGGIGDQHVVEVALPDDGVLLPPDPPVGEDLPDVEETAREAVQPVLRLPRPEQRAGDGHLAELQGQVPGGVVDGEADLGHGEGGALERAGKDDVLHPAPPQRPGALLAQHPGDGVDDVRLARAVGPHDDADARLQGERGPVRKGLEPTQRQGFQEHSD